MTLEVHTKPLVRGNETFIVGMVVAAFLGHTISSCKPPISLHAEATVQFVMLPIVY